MTKEQKDIAMSEEANAWLADFVRDKIRERVRDPEIAEKLMPDHYVMTKRPILEDGYFETLQPRQRHLGRPARGTRSSGSPQPACGPGRATHPIDVLVLATGFDAISGTMLRLNPKGRGGVSLKERWSDRFHNYLGLTVAGFPQPVHDPTVPGRPGCFYNMPLGAERQMDWIGNCMRHLRERELGAVEPTTASEEAWGNEVSALADVTLFPRTDSWWTGANIPGKPRYFSAYLIGMNYYQAHLRSGCRGTTRGSCSSKCTARTTPEVRECLPSAELGPNRGMI